MLNVYKNDNCYKGSFTAMASPCDVIVETADRQLAQHLLQLAQQEAARIEHKFSRYRNDNIIHQINNAHGCSIKVDEETGLLLDFAENCFHMSEGLFDVTSGILRRCWKFGKQAEFPARSCITEALQLIGWQNVDWRSPYLCLKDGMEIDFGGIGKEYAVDRTVLILSQHTDMPLLVNFGGDLHASKPRNGSRPWLIGMENARDDNASRQQISLLQGALTTSGDSQRYLLHRGKRYSHILNPTTGYPVSDCPASISVAAKTCLEAGIMSTLAMLHGADAEQFLKAQQMPYWCQRHA